LKSQFQCLGFHWNSIPRNWNVSRIENLKISGIGIENKEHFNNYTRIEFFNEREIENTNRFSSVKVLDFRDLKNTK
jgi:hypothetical protein